MKGNKEKTAPMDTDRIEIIRRLEKELKYKRFVHTLFVAGTAASLAMRWGSDPGQAEMAGLLHDCAKSLTLQEMRKLCEQEGVAISSYEEKSAALLHSKAGSILAKSSYGCTDEEILQAIRSHTTGRPGMSLLEKIIFVADYIEPGRYEAPGLPQIRPMAFEDLDRAVLRILSDTLEHLNAMKAEIDPMTQETYDYYAHAMHLVLEVK